MNAKETIAALIEKKRDLFTQASDNIWGTPETRFATEKSVQEHYKVLEKEGFKIEKGLADMDYSYVATYGSGKPVIGILGEYDALDNLSQIADLGEEKPEVPNANGHGCGHNMLGTGALAGAVGIKDFMEQENLSGTIKLFGCPAEESGYGKAFMARAGVFDDLDAALSWHPLDHTAAWSDSSLAVYQVYYNFKGIPAHASMAPETGRSALDAAELMNVGVQFLREHVEQSVRIHYAFIDAGGKQANTVQQSASLYYFIRAPKAEQAGQVYERLNKIAQGAALMTETDLEIKFDSACANYLPNHAITKVMYDNLKTVGQFDVTDEDQEYIRRYTDKHITENVRKSLYQRAKNWFPEYSDEKIKEISERPLFGEYAPLVFTDKGIVSTDVGDVSWVTPTAQVFIGCEPQGAASHTWQWVANGKSQVAHKGLLSAGKAIATTAYDLLTNPELLEKAKAEHIKTLDGEVYKSAIPEDVKPS